MGLLLQTKARALLSKMLWGVLAAGPPVLFNQRSRSSKNLHKKQEQLGAHLAKVSGSADRPAVSQP